MFPAGKHPTYPYTEEDRRTVHKNAAMTEAELSTNVEAIKTWIQKEPHLAEAGIETRMAEHYVIMARGSVERAKQRIECYYRERVNLEEVHNRVQLLREHPENVFRTHVIYSAPKLYNGMRISYLKVLDWDKVTVEETAMSAFMIADIRLVNDFMSGDEVVFDLADLSLTQLLKYNLVTLAKTLWIIQHGIGIRLFCVHIINCNMSGLAQSLINILTPALNKKVMKRLKFHDTLEDFQKCIPKDYMSEEYGGNLPSITYFQEKMRDMILNEKTKQYLIDSCKLMADESKRLHKEYNADCLQGNFKKLELD